MYHEEGLQSKIDDKIEVNKFVYSSKIPLNLKYQSNINLSIHINFSFNFNIHIVKNLHMFSGDKSNNSYNLYVRNEDGIQKPPSLA